MEDLTGHLIRSLKSVTAYKYAVLLILLIVLIVSLSYDQATGAANFKEFGSNFLTAIVTGLLLTLVQDLFVRKEMNLAEEIKLQSLAHALSTEILGRYGLSVVPQEQLGEFISEIVKDESCLNLLAHQAVDSDAEASMIKNSVFHQLWSEPLVTKLRQRSRLYDVGDGVHYAVTHTKEFSITKKKKQLRCIITGENEIGSKIDVSVHDCDELIFASKPEKGIAELIKAMNLRLIQKSVRQGALKSTEIYPRIQVAQFSSVFPEWPADWDNRVAVIDYDISNIPGEATFELQYRIVNSYDDGFFFEAIRIPAIVDSIEIDYSGIKQHLSRVTIVNTVTCRWGEANINRSIGFVAAHPNSYLLWPGQGIFVIWRRHSPQIPE